MSILKRLRQYPSALAGLTILLVFILFCIHTVITLPYSEAVRLWRGGPGVWDDQPRRAAPIWYDWFTRDKQSRTIVVTLEDGEKTVEPRANGMNRITVVLPFEFQYDRYPKELILSTEAAFTGRRQIVSVQLRRPDGQTMVLDDRLQIREAHSYRISQDMGLRMKLRGISPHVALFATDPNSEASKPLKGSYEMIIQGDFPEQQGLSAAKLVVFGQVHGLAGTDHLRRDLTVALRWGAPVGLTFGVLAAIGVQVTTFILGGIGTWFGGRLDATFQRITEVMMILPMLAVLIMIGHFYSRSIWVMLGGVILLNIFGSSMKVYRAMFLQAKESPYIEAARAYGAGNFRIIFHYLLPRLMPVLLPQFVTVIPMFVFLEATLAVLGLGDPVLPTWGKVIYDAQSNDALYMGDFYWMVQPAVLLMMIGFSFSLVGYTLDSILNPRLRKI